MAQREDIGNGNPLIQLKQNKPMSKIKYPVLGYAPGNYQCKCSTCEEVFIGDKQAVQCEPCAINCLNLTLTASVDRIGELEKALANLAKEYNELEELAKVWKEESGN